MNEPRALTQANEGLSSLQLTALVQDVIDRRMRGAHLILTRETSKKRRQYAIDMIVLCNALRRFLKAFGGVPDDYGCVPANVVKLPNSLRDDQPSNEGQS